MSKITNQLVDKIFPKKRESSPYKNYLNSNFLLENHYGSTKFHLLDVVKIKFFHVFEDEFQEPEIDDKFTKDALYKVPGSLAPPGESDKGIEDKCRFR